MDIKFEKWEGLGNDFIILENIQATPDLAKKLCDRNFGIGADGIFSAKKDENADIAWDFYNSDGSIAQMCGNGIRCFAKYACEHRLVDKKIFSVMTMKGIVIPEILENGYVKVNMGKPVFKAEEIPVKTDTPLDFEVEGFSASAVSMGNPHCLIFTNEDGRSLARTIGQKIENSPLFPEKTNVEFINVLHFNKILVNVWERGCGITLACGTGACASVVAGVKKGLLDNNVEVELPGGSLFIEYKDGSNVYMTGSARKVFEGIYKN
ncbi:MAG: diaminopimelate epimerase [Candidatus Gastranaerophilales bacterium]|nr:diaminopimelate epimerase [Candidatus Gastranaerophilales bacterium]